MLAARHDPDAWTLRCRDQRGRRTTLSVDLTEGGIVVSAAAPGPWVFEPLQAGRLRAVVRDALLALDRLDDAGHQPVHSGVSEGLCQPAAE
jgi:hypothetical protein